MVRLFWVALAAIADQPGKFSLSPAMRQVLMVAICGSFTTFSSFIIQTLELLQAAGNVVVPFFFA